LQRLRTTPLALLANTAMLDAPTPAALAATNPMSVKATPVVVPCTCSAYPPAGAIVASLAAL
jgi:hypothetical protein